jgi:hypothetical protein
MNACSNICFRRLPEADNITCKRLINKYIHKIRINKYNGVMFMFKFSNNDIYCRYLIQPGVIARIIKLIFLLVSSVAVPYIVE